MASEAGAGAMQMLFGVLRTAFGGTGDGIGGRILRGGAISLALILIGTIIGLATHLLLSRTMGLSEYGRFSIALSWALLLAVPATLGLDEVILRFASQYHAAGERDHVGRALMWAIRWQALGLVVATPILLLARSQYPRSFGLNTGIDALWLLVIMAATTALSIASAVFRAAQRVFYSQVYVQVVRALLLLACIGGAYVAGVAISADVAIAMAALATVLALSIVAVHLWRLPIWGRRTDEASPDRRRWLAFGARALSNTLIQQALVLTPLPLLGVVAGPVEAGLYAASYRLATLATFVLSALASITAPMIVAAHQRQDRTALARIALVNARIATAAALAACAVFAMFGEPILASFGPDFVRGYPILLVLLAGTAFNAFSGACSNLLSMTDRQNDVLTSKLVGAAVYAVGASLLVLVYGAVGVALAAAAGNVVMNAMMTWRVRRSLGIDSTALARPVREGS